MSWARSSRGGNGGSSTAGAGWGSWARRPKQLGYHRKPIAVLDLDGFYQPLWGQIQRGIDTGFIKPEYLDLWYPAPDVDALLRYLEGYAPHGYGAKWP